MNVDELYRLGTWYVDQFSEINRLYSELLEIINYNAQQPDKRPVEGHLNALTEFLFDQRFDELSLEQLKMLTTLGVGAYIGPEGAANVESAVRTSNYDPATAVQRLNAAVQSINSTRGLLAAYVDAVNNLGLRPEDVLADESLITIRVGFQADVGIHNVTEWKDAAREWYDIIRGLSMACDEKPEDVQIIGAASGSIILIMAGTPIFTALLARISKHLTSVAKDIIGVRVAMEDLRQKQLLTKAMENEFKKMEKDKAEGAVRAVENLLEDKVKLKDGEVKTALNRSIEKLLTFNEKGGTVDFVLPRDGEELEQGREAEADGLKAALIEARAAIREYQGERESLKLLSDGTATA